jgi:pimeloyl-ACP methyl ester carboxylesterase
MNKFTPWNSQPLNEWAQKYAQGKFIDLDGKSTHYIEKGKGKPLILIHGFFYDSFTWHNNIDLLAEHFKVYALDLWGFGYSTREPLDYGYPLFTRQVLQFLDKLNIEKASLMGHSMGGGTSINFSVKHPERINKLVLVDAAAMPNSLPFLGKVTNLPMLGELMFGLNANFFRKMALNTNWIKNPKFISDEYFENATRFQKVKGSSEVMLKILRKQFFHTIPDKVKDLGKMNKQMLIVWGQHDTAIPVARGNEMHDLLPGSQFEIIEDAGHCPHDETSEQFNTLVLSYLTD